jgi:hypothetical protein
MVIQRNHLGLADAMAIDFAQVLDGLFHAIARQTDIVDRHELVLVNGFDPEGLSGDVSVSSDIALAGLFLDVIERHVLGLDGLVMRCHRAITDWDLATLQCDIVPSARV